VLERFAGELEEILHSLERAKKIPPPPASDEPAPAKEPPYRPPSIHFERGPISSRIDPDAMRPLLHPPPASRSGLRLTFEAFFLILVAAISAQSGLRPLLIAGAEIVAFLIVASVELAIARDRHPSGAPLLPAAPPAQPYPLALESSGHSQSALEDVEPLIWSVGKSEPVEVVAEIETEPEVERAPEAEPSWPLAAIEREAEPDGAEVKTGEVESRAPLESTIEITAPPAAREDAAAETAEPLVLAGEAIEQEARAAEPKVEATRRRRLFRRRTVRPAQPEETEPTAEEASVAEPELALEESGERHPRRSRRQRDGFAETPAATEVEAAPEAGPAPELEPELEAEPREHRRWFGARHEAVEEDETEAEAESEPESKRGFHLFRHVEEPEGESDGGLESAIEIPAPVDLSVEATEEEAPAPELEPELEAEPREHRRWFGARHEAVEEDETEAEAVEPSPEVETEHADTAAAASTAEVTAEIELSQGISIREIEQTLDELESRRPRSRARRWRFRVDALKDVEEHSSAADAELEETLRLESEFRLNAEQERRRREREYQRSLRN
jgi:hypothetical protein